MLKTAIFKTRILRDATLLFCCAGLNLGAVGQTPSPASFLPDPSVVVVSDPRATEAFSPRPERVAQMVTHGITNLAGTTDPREAWRKFVSPTNTVGIKVFSLPGAHSGTRPAVVAAVIEGLLSAGVPSSNIVIWDKHLVDLRLAGYRELASRYEVRLLGSTDSGYDPATSYEHPIIGNLVWGDLEFGRGLGTGSERTDRQEPSALFPSLGAERGLSPGRRSHVARLVSTGIDKIISIAPLLNHNSAGVSGNLYSVAIGSVDNTVRFEYDAGRLAQAVPEIFALPSLSDKVVLNITDALVCQYEGGERALLHYATMLNELWFSRDPVALDVMSLRELENQRKRFNAPSRKNQVDLYSNANLLELGTSDPEKIPVRRFSVPAELPEPGVTPERPPKPGP